MSAKVQTIAFAGIEAIAIDVQVHIGAGLPFFTIVGLPDKSIAEAKERIRAAFSTIGLSLPPKRITVNMSPASMQKEGSHYDLPIAIGILVEMGLIAQDAINDWLLLGELSLDGLIQKVPGVLMAAMFAHSRDLVLVCPFEDGAQARIASDELNIYAAKSIQELIAHTKGEFSFSQIFDAVADDETYDLDFNEVHGQEVAKRGLEIAAVGQFHVLLIGPPGVGKSMLAKRMNTILPPLTPHAALEVTMVYSMANKLRDKVLLRKRPYRDPHHSASLAALIGGGAKALPGEVTLAHNGILFLDELAEYSRVLEGLRECMENESVAIARAQNHVTYPANAQIIAAMNPCRCGYFNTQKACARAPVCAKEYQNRISGPIMDRFDITVYMDQYENLGSTHHSDSSAQIRARVLSAIDFQKTQFDCAIHALKVENMRFDDVAYKFLLSTCDHNKTTRRGFVKLARIARVIANLDQSQTIKKIHVAESLMYRKQ